MKTLVAAALATVQVEQRLIARSGVNTDVELALFNANHGDRERAIELARRAWAAVPARSG